MRHRGREQLLVSPADRKLLLGAFVSCRPLSSGRGRGGAPLASGRQFSHQQQNRLRKVGKKRNGSSKRFEAAHKTGGKCTSGGVCGAARSRL